MSHKGEEVYVSRMKRMHLVINFVRNFLLGAFLWLFHDQFITPSFTNVFHSLGYRLPAGVLMASGLLILYARFVNQTMVARVGILLGDIVLLTFLISYIVTLFQEQRQYGGWLPVVMASMVAHDFVLISASWLDPNDYSYNENSD